MKANALGEPSDFSALLTRHANPLILTVNDCAVVAV
jgi:hypothetical protein